MLENVSSTTPPQPKGLILFC